MNVKTQKVVAFSAKIVKLSKQIDQIVNAQYIAKLNETEVIFAFAQLIESNWVYWVWSLIE